MSFWSNHLRQLAYLTKPQVKRATWTSVFLPQHSPKLHAYNLRTPARFRHTETEHHPHHHTSSVATSTTHHPPPPPHTSASAEQQSSSKRKIGRGWIIFGTITATYAVFKTADYFRLKHEKEIILREAKKIADEPLPVGEHVRHLIVIRPKNSKEQFKQYIKPVMDAAALDYTTFEVSDGDSVVDLVKTLNLQITSNQRADGVIVVGTDCFRGILVGLVERFREDPDSTFTIGYIPLWHSYGLGKLSLFLNQADIFRVLGTATLAVAEGFRRPLETIDLEWAEAMANKKAERRRRLQNPDKDLSFPNEIIGAVHVYSFAPERTNWRQLAEIVENKVE